VAGKIRARCALGWAAFGEIANVMAPGHSDGRGTGSSSILIGLLALSSPAMKAIGWQSPARSIWSAPHCAVRAARWRAYPFPVSLVRKALHGMRAGGAARSYAPDKE
jgi:hypothetical protein